VSGGGTAVLAGLAEIYAVLAVLLMCLAKIYAR